MQRRLEKVLIRSPPDWSHVRCRAASNVQGAVVRKGKQRRRSRSKMEKLVFVEAHSSKQELCKNASGRARGERATLQTVGRVVPSTETTDHLRNATPRHPRFKDV